MPQMRLTAAYLVVSAIALIGYLAFDGVIQALSYLTMSALVVGAVAVGVRLHRPSDVRPWIVLALGQTAFLIADAIWYVATFSNSGETPYPSIADLFYLIGYALLAMGMVMFIRARQPRYRRTAAIDALLIGIAAVLVLWVTVIDGVIHEESIPFVERLVTIAYPMADALILAVGAYMLLTGGHGRRSLYLFVGSLVALLAGDVLETALGLAGAASTLTDALWLISYVLFGLAALDPSMRELTQAAPRPIKPESAGRLVLIALAIVALPAFAVYQRFFTDHIDLPVVGIAGITVIVAILVRMHELGAVLGRSERRYASLLAKASDAFAIVEPTGRFIYVSPASERVLGYPIDDTLARSAFDLIHRSARERSKAVLELVAATAGATEEFEVPVRRADREWRWLSVTATNRMDDPIVGGIVLNYRDITERRQLEKRLERQAFTDALTGLANRPLFIDRLDHMLDRRRRTGADVRVSVLFLDVDDFKTVNDSLGHGVGDKLLVALAERLRATLRPADTAARLGGDEFAVLLDGAQESDARNVAQRILDKLAEPVRVAEFEVSVTVSLGICVDSMSTSASAEELLRDADLAMYTAKSRQAGSFAVYDPGMHAAAVRRLERKTDRQKHQPDLRTTTRLEPVSTAT
jgi:diguanylate cyclase (GGDEF)-like protein/PAS domain S-box-containing protein